MKHSALRRYVSASLGALLGAGFFLVPSVPFAATLTVNTLDDSWNGGCDVTHCSLLEAIADAGSSDTINFDFSALILPIGGPVITLAVGLPPIVADHLTIDGYDCTGCGGVSENTADPVNGLNMQIGPTIDGAGVVAFWPLLSVAAHDVTLRGLNLINSGSDAIYVTGGDVDELQVEGCIIGLARDGVTPAGNAGAGIYLDRGDDPVIGPYNVISGNSGAGIEIAGNYPDDGVIFGNLIGTDITATVGVGNGGHGISATATSVSSGQSAQRDWAIGSVLPAEQNVISGNGGHGIYMERRVWNFDVVGNVIGLSGDQIFPIGNGGDGVRMIGASGSTNFPKDSSFEDNVISGNGGSGLYCHACRDQDVYRNSIGTNEWGDPGLGNTEAGIYIYGSNYHNSEDWLIGSSSPADSNDIAYNGGDGIRLRRGTGSKQSRRHTIGINQFYSNGGLAIDLEGATTGDGPSVPTATSCSNDNSLGNRGAARPVIDSVGIQAGILEVSGTSCNSATVYLFVAEPDPSGYGEPTIYLDTVQANSAGLWSYSQPAAGLGSGTFITAYSEDGDGETGEAAANVEILGCDDDSDGFDSLNCGGPDCDDNDAGINPAAPEACDGIDTNCDGLLGVDEIDIDGDGQSVCAGDCDSTDITIYLGAPELCDGLDNDCDGLLSAGEVDSDGDGYMVCDGDCADADGAVFPGAAEVCDGVDTNCDGALGSGEVDSDGDGFLLCDGDCDDTSTSSYPGAPELCDGLDNDCDGVVPGDELDGDGDGLAVCAGDCDDTDSGVYLGAAELCDGLDNDCDGSLLADEVDADGDGVLVCAGDCNDAAAAIYPGAPEVCDGLDNDCDGVLGATEVDADGDGVMVCDGDCQDTDPAIYPGAAELCDGLDNDCDGALGPDELDSDGDGVTGCDGDCDDSEATVFPGATEVCGDGIDQDCDGVDLSADDDDGDGYTTCIGDCDDTNDTVYPGAVEVCDGLDNDCDGFLGADELDLDGDGYTGCDGDCDDTDASVHPGADEICDDGIDQNCDGGETAEDDLDGDGYDACVDCDDSVAVVYPGAPELCDGLDNDCDGAPSDGEVDLDGDGFMICDGDCDDDLADVHPGAEELCADALDSDCDGALDPQDMDADDDGFDTDLCGGADCDDADAAVHPDATEICEDGVDSNCDGTEENCMTLGDSVPLVAGGGCSACDLTDSGGRPAGRALWFGLFLMGGLARRRRL